MLVRMERTWLRNLALALAGLIFAVGAGAAHAEKLTFDHRLHPALKAALDSGNDEMVAYDGSNPRYLVNVIAIRGKSARDWTEALEIISRSPDKTVRTAADWAAEMRGRADAICPNTVTPIAEDAISVTFERRMPGCPGARAETAMTRVVAGKRSLFLLTFLFKGVPDAATRQEWLALLASAHLE